MKGSTFGNQFSITTWGESHGKAMGCVVDGCPAGLSIKEGDIQHYLNRRKPNQNPFTTARNESDTVEILSGVFEGRTTGTPISLIIYNRDQRPKDYQQIKDFYRPGHGDYTFFKKYGIRDYRGGGRTSGRETISRVAGGAIAIHILKELGIQLTAYTKAIGSISVPNDSYRFDETLTNPLYMPNQEYARKAILHLQEVMEKEDSCGGIVECIATGIPIGLGEPVFNKLDSNLAKAIMSIGSVKGVEIGDGFEVANSLGSTNNDQYSIKNNVIQKNTNHSGGVLGGLSDGSNLIVRAAIKPTPSIAQTQSTVSIYNEETNISISGRHDPIIVPRAVVVVESMIAITVVDLLLQNMTSKLDNVKLLYSNEHQNSHRQ